MSVYFFIVFIDGVYNSRLCSKTHSKIGCKIKLNELNDFFLWPKTNDHDNQKRDRKIL